MSAAPGDIIESNATSTQMFEHEMFEVVWRGYDREQVDQHIRSLLGQLEAERHSAELASKDLRRVQNELANARPSSAGEETHSFGHRVEKILRMAELEAAEIRRKATDDASALMEKARVEAEAYRHDAERQMIVRASNLDQEAARRNAALSDREAEIAAEHAAAKQRADELRSDAEREAERVRKHADAVAQELRTQAERAAQEQRDLAAREVHHLVKVQDEARSGIRRLHEMLAAELSFSTGLASMDSTDSGEFNESDVPQSTMPSNEHDQPAESKKAQKTDG
jgi:F0F1-type ATP synthase membrane subunit b/b'